MEKGEKNSHVYKKKINNCNDDMGLIKERENQWNEELSDCQKKNGHYCKRCGQYN
jgi:hypothetical protein